MKMFIHLFSIISILCIGIAYVQADDEKAANPRQHKKQELLKKYDANGNGVLDEDEIKLIAKDRFKKFDKNGDGKLDQAELRGVRKASKQMPKMTKEEKSQALARAKGEERALRRQKSEESASKAGASEHSKSEQSK